MLLIDSLPRREREALEALSGLGEATAADVQAEMPDAPGYSAVRTLLGRLERKGLVERRADTHAHLYRLLPEPEELRQSALRGVIGTLFGGSAVRAATALVNMADRASDDELEALQRAINEWKGSRR
jgi:predicted transcriptional regulator